MLMKTNVDVEYEVDSGVCPKPYCVWSDPGEGEVEVEEWEM